MEPCLLVALGDSITYGYPYGRRASWVAIAERACGKRLVNAGIPGDTTARLRKRFAPAVLAHAPRYVLVMGGTNDARAAILPRVVWANLDTICAAAWSHGIVPILGLPPPLAGPEESLLQEYRSILGAYDAVVDFCSPFLDAQGRLREDVLRDGIHPTRAGYQIMARALLDSRAVPGLAGK
jgi:lysophospholipase L1-like esterase